MSIGNTWLTSKEQTAAYPPVFLITIVMVNGGPTQYICSRAAQFTQGLVYSGQLYMDRVLSQNIAQLQSMSSQGIDTIGQFTLKLADADTYFWLLEQQYGFQGSTMTVTLRLWEPVSNQFSPDGRILFSGLCDGANRSESDNSLSVRAVASNNPAKKTLPIFPIQRTCPKTFPSTLAQRQAAQSDQTSIYYACGYSPDVTGGVGSLSGSTPFTSCTKDITACQSRGMFNTDASNRVTRRFGGVEWNPPATWKGKNYASGNTFRGINSINVAKWTEWAPLTFGTVWVNCVIANVVGDPNSTRFECIVASGDMNSPVLDYSGEGVQLVVVNNLLIPRFDQTSDLLFRWYPLTDGNRQGIFNTTEIYNSQGDPYGSLATVFPIVYQQVQDSSSVPSVQVLVGPRMLPTYATPTSSVVYQRTDNLAWVALEILRLIGIPNSAVDLSSVINSATLSGTGVSYINLTGQTASHRRYGISLSLEREQSASAILSAIRMAGKLMIVPNGTGTQLRFVTKQPMANQQPSPVAGSNYNNPVSSYRETDDPSGPPYGVGYFAYWFNDSNIMRGTVQMMQDGIEKCPDVLTLAINDEDNEWTADTVTIGDDIAYGRILQNIQTSFAAIGLPNYDQAFRCGQTYLAELYRGNPRDDSGGTWRFQFKSTYRGAHLNMGDIIAISLQQWNISLQACRVEGITPDADFEQATYVVRWHDDRWYTDLYGQKASPYSLTPGIFGANRAPWPWQAYTVSNWPCDPLYGAGHVVNSFWTYGISAGADLLPDHSVLPEMVITGVLPVNNSANPLSPRIARQGTAATTGGDLPDGFIWFASVTALDASGNEGPLPYVPCITWIPGAAGTNQLTVPVLAWPPGTSGWHMYIGTDQQQLHLANTGTGTPASVTATSLTNLGRPPDPAFDHFILRAKRLGAGAGYLVLGPGLNNGNTIPLNVVTTSTIAFQYAQNIQTGQPYIPANGELNGYVLMCVAESGGGTVPFVNVTVVGNTGLTVTIDETGYTDLTQLDLTQCWFLALRKVTGYGGTSIQFADASSNTAGFGGQILRVIAGTSAGSQRTVVAGNFSGGIAIDTPFDLGLDGSSVCIVEEPNWRIEQVQPSVKNAAYDNVSTLKALFDNAPGEFWFTQVSSANANAVEVVDALRPFRIFYWQGAAPGESLYQGLNLVPNWDFGIAPSYGEITAGWLLTSAASLAIGAGLATVLNHDVIYAGRNCIRVSAGTVVVPPNAGSAAVAFYSNPATAPYPIPRPGEAYFMSIAIYLEVSSPIPTGLEMVAGFRTTVWYSDGTLDTATAGGPIGTLNAWVLPTGTLSINPTKVPVGMQTDMECYWLNTTGSPITACPGSNSFFLWFNAPSLIRIINVGTEATATSSAWANQQGSIVPSQTLTISVPTNHNNGSGSCTVELSWSAQTLLRSDPSTPLTVPAGNLTWTGLSASTEYYFYLRINESDGTVHCASGDPNTTPPTAPSGNYAMNAAQDTWYPLPLMTVTTPANSGSGGGSGGGPGSCPEASELVYVDARGVIPIGSVAVGDYIRGLDWTTGGSVFYRVKERRTHPSSTWRMVNGKRVSPMHPVSYPAKLQWVFPYRIGSLDTKPGLRVQLTLDVPIAAYDSQNFALVDQDGNDVLIMHNYFVSPS